jgi:hypothetical protein
VHAPTYDNGENAIPQIPHNEWSAISDHENSNTTFSSALTDLHADNSSLRRFVSGILLRTHRTVYVCRPHPCDQAMRREPIEFSHDAPMLRDMAR